MTANYYAWRVSGKPVEVELNLAVVDRIQALAAAAHGRGEEGVLFGLLLGRSRRQGGKVITCVEDFEPLNMARLRGRPEAPEGCDLDVVGLYHSRPGAELRLDHIDAALIGTSFTGPGMVYLVIQPEPEHASRAAFFIQEEGAVHGYAPYLVFPFHSGLLRESGSLTEGRPAAPRRRAGWIAAAAAAVGVGVLGLVLSRSSGEQTGDISADAQPAAAVVQGEPAAQPAASLDSPRPVGRPVVKKSKKEARRNARAAGHKRAKRVLAESDDEEERPTQAAVSSSRVVQQRPGRIRRLWTRISNITNR